MSRHHLYVLLLITATTYSSMYAQNCDGLWFNLDVGYGGLEIVSGHQLAWFDDLPDTVTTHSVFRPPRRVTEYTKFHLSHFSSDYVAGKASAFG